MGLGQILDTSFSAGTNYRLTVEVGNSWHYYWSGYSVQLSAGDTVIAEDYNKEWPDYMAWATSTVECNNNPVDSGLEGELLAIRLLNLGLNLDNANTSYWSWSDWEWKSNKVGVEFDDVRLAASSVPTPEPATMFLLGAGLLGLAGVGRKKLFRR